MLSEQVELAAVTEQRQHDISSWQDADITLLRSKHKKRYHKRKSAIIDYFTTDKPADEIACQHHITAQALDKLARDSRMLHADGTEWGFRALVPCVIVCDHRPASSQHNEDTPPSDPSQHEPEGAAGCDMPARIPLSPMPNPEDTALDREAPFIADHQEHQEHQPPPEESKADTTQRLIITDTTPSTTSGMDLSASPLVLLKEEEALTVPEEEPSTTGAGSDTATLANDDDQRHLEDDQRPFIAPTGWDRAEPTPPGSSVTLPLLAPQDEPETGYMSGGTSIQRHLARKRLYQRAQKRQRQKQQHLHQIIAIAVLSIMLLIVVIPLGAGLASYNLYNNIRATAYDGINHLLKVKSLLPISRSDPLAALNSQKLQQAQDNFAGAEQDFTQLQQLVNRPDVQSAVQQFAPEYSGKLIMAQHLLQVGLDVSRMGSEMCGIAILAADIVHGSPLAAGSTKPLITQANVDSIEGSLVHALYYISDIRSQFSQISLDQLPLSASQKTQVRSLIPLLPEAQNMVLQAQGLVGLVSWLLGVGQARRFLVQTMDRAELRPGGGFTGQYGILSIQDGRMAPFTLTDVTLIDYGENGTAIGRRPPPAYAWMNFGNWGVRDSNLSADFPTTANMTMQLFEQEGGGPLDGDIAFTPILIGHMLDITGPLVVPAYGETITSKNLEDRLHFYQQNFSAIAREKQISGDYGHTGRKAFTSTLGKMLLDRVRHLPVKELLQVIKTAAKDIQSRDLEIYFTNPAAEQWLVEHNYAGTMNTFSQQDGFIVVQANISISKASQYVQTTETDNVTLDAQGNAYHNMTITLDYQQKGPVYGFDTYADYIRVYAPPGAQLLWGDGFDTGKPLCIPVGVITTPTPSPSSAPSPPPGGPPTIGCSQYQTSFPSNARYCPTNDYSLGARTYFNNIAVPWPIDSLGPPTALNSDLPGRSMWGGLTETPKNCTSYISLSWFVPHAVKYVHGQPTYTLLVQKQSGYYPTIVLTVDTSAFKRLKPFTFTGVIYDDRLFSLAAKK